MAAPAHARRVLVVEDEIMIRMLLEDMLGDLGYTVAASAGRIDEAVAAARNGDFDVTMAPKKTVTSVLKKAGTVEYYCRFHPNMKAVLTIAP